MVDVSPDLVRGGARLSLHGCARLLAPSLPRSLARSHSSLISAVRRNPIPPPPTLEPLMKHSVPGRPPKQQLTGLLSRLNTLELRRLTVVFVILTPGFLLLQAGS